MKSKKWLPLWDNSGVGSARALTVVRPRMSRHENMSQATSPIRCGKAPLWHWGTAVFAAPAPSPLPNRKVLMESGCNNRILHITRTLYTASNEIPAIRLCAASYMSTWSRPINMSKNRHRKRLASILVFKNS